MGTMAKKIILFILLIHSFLLVSLWAQSGSQADDTASITSLLAKARKVTADSAVILYKQAIGTAENNLKNGRSKALKEAFTRLLVKSQLELGLLYYQKLDYNKSLQQNQEALKTASNLSNPYYIGECYFNIAEVYLEQSRFADAMKFYRQALDQYRKAGDKSGEFWSYTGMGIVQKQTGNYKDAIVCYTDALATAQKGGMKNEEASCFNNLGNVYRRQGDFTKAMESYQKAITVFKEIKDDDAVSDCLNNIGNLYLDNGNPFRALDYFRQSLKIALDKKDEYRLIIRYKNMANAYSDLKDYENAAQYLNDALKLAEKSGDKSFIASCNMLFGKLHSSKNDFAIARAYYEKAIQLYNEIGAIPEKLNTLVELANTLLASGNTKEALLKALEAERLALLTGSLKARLDANLCLARCYENTGDAVLAFRYLKQATQLKDSIYSVEKFRTIEEIEAGFVKAQLKKENEALSQNDLLQKQVIKTRNILLLLLGISLILTVALLWLIFKRQQGARRETALVKQLSSQQIEKLNHDLTLKERELTSKTIFINQKNQLLGKLIGELDELKKSEVSTQSIQHLQVQLKQELSPNAWKEFEVQFNEVHPGFQQRLLEKYPDLTPAERRLCAFIRLDMNTREISSLSGQSIKSIEVARTRIRKKLNVPHEQNLTNFIALL